MALRVLPPAELASVRTTWPTLVRISFAALALLPKVSVLLAMLPVSFAVVPASAAVFAGSVASVVTLSSRVVWDGSAIEPSTVAAPPPGVMSLLPVLRLTSMVLPVPSPKIVLSKSPVGPMTFLMALTLCRIRSRGRAPD